MLSRNIQGILCYSTSCVFLFYSMAIQVSPSIMTKTLMLNFHLNAAQLALLASCYFYAYILMQIPAALILNHYKPQFIVTLAILISSFGILPLAFSHNIYWIVAGRILTGFGSAFSLTGILIIATKVFPQTYFPLLTGIGQTFAALGGIFTASLLPTVIAASGFHRSVMYLTTFGLFLALSSFIIMRLSKHSFTPSEKTRDFAKMLLLISKKPLNWQIALYGFCNWGPLIIFAGLWGASFLHLKYHISLIQAADLIHFLWIGLIISSPLVGWACTRYLTRNTLMLLASLVGIFSSYAILFFPLSQHTLPIFLFLLGSASTGQLLSFEMIKQNNPTNQHAIAIGFNSMIIPSSAAILQPLSGWILQYQSKNTLTHNIPKFTIHDFQLALSIMPISFLLSILIMLFIMFFHHPNESSFYKIKAKIHTI
jgi:MFS family permease